MASPPASLETHRWHHRLLVISNPTTDLEAGLEKHRDAIEEREIIVIRLVADAAAPIDAEIDKKFGFSAESKGILLIGKDGRTTVRWAVDDFSIETLFARIDAMPMRQREMRERR